MWGSIVTEASMQTNFNFGFSSYKSDILIHLSQWQYWWWFWFSLIWVMYYYIIIFNLSKRTFLFNPILNTSLRGHGKWGDFLVALIPLSWCGNILVNSNFILRMIEWQNEGSLFTIRIQGKQWYWVYKYDITTIASLLSTPKNIGHNKWIIWTPMDSFTFDSYNQPAFLATQLEYLNSYQQNLIKNETDSTNLKILSFTPNIQKKKNTIAILPNHNLYFKKLLPFGQKWNIELFTNTKTASNKLQLITTTKTIIPTDSNFIILTTFLENFSTVTEEQKQFASATITPVNGLLTIKFLNTFFGKSLSLNHYENSKLDDLTDTTTSFRLHTSTRPFRIHRTPLNSFNLGVLLGNQNSEVISPIKLTNQFFTVSFNKNNHALTPKMPVTEELWGFRQKKYKRVKKFLFGSRVYYDPQTFAVLTKTAYAVKQLLTTPNAVSPYLNLPVYATSYSLPANHQYVLAHVNTSYPVTNKGLINKNLVHSRDDQITNLTSTYNYNSIKTYRQKSELIPVTLARRLLRTKRTLVLPAHVNLTLITNSYDVVHSWFVPGLGLKIDCVPGRSTHHSFYIDNIGFYYGQCAEICGRYHHHMPIRVCALPFEHFMVWWQVKGLPRICRLQKTNLNYKTALTL